MKRKKLCFCISSCTLLIAEAKEEEEIAPLYSFSILHLYTCMCNHTQPGMTLFYFALYLILLYMYVYLFFDMDKEQCSVLYMNAFILESFNVNLFRFI